MTSDRIWPLLLTLVGEWAGSGVGEFPTIERFEYRESFSVRAVGERTLQYQQLTRRATENGEVVPSHHEIGFLGLAETGSITLTSAHGLDRLEAMDGELRESADGFVVTFASTSLAHDERMIRSWREWAVQSDHLHYDMGMATRSTPNGAHHLSADLYRTST